MTNNFSTHVVLLSDNVLSAVLPALDYNLRPQKVVLCETDSMQGKGVGSRLSTFFKANNIKVETFKLGSTCDFQEVHRKFSELASRYEKQSQNVAVNLGGGDGLISTAAQSVFGVKNFACIQSFPQRNEVFIIWSGKVQRYEFQDKLKLNDYFSIHGCNLKSKREKNLKLMSGSHALCRELLADFDFYSKYISYLGRLASGAENHLSLKAKAKITVENKRLFDLFQRHGFISAYDDGVVTFASDDDRDFCKGIWLEDHLHQTLKNLSKDAGLQDFATCLEFTGSTGFHYDLDAAFLVKNRLYVIEAGSFSMNERGNDDLFRFDYLRDFDVAGVVPIVISFRELRNSDVRRVERLGVQLIQGQEINELESKIRTLLQLS